MRWPYELLSSAYPWLFLSDDLRPRSHASATARIKGLKTKRRTLKPEKSDYGSNISNLAKTMPHGMELFLCNIPPDQRGS
jgi:hypothetical protein